LCIEQSLLRQIRTPSDDPEDVFKRIQNQKGETLPMLVLGITAPASWNTAAALLRDGELVAAAEEERFVRIKHAPNLPPLHAMAWCLKAAGVGLENVDVIAVGWRDPVSYWICSGWEELRSARPLGCVTASANVLEYLFRLIRTRKEMRRIFANARMPQWVFVPHHLAHAASAYYVSGMEESIVLTVDGNGEDDSGWMGVGRRGTLHRWKKIRPDQSLGVLYGTVTGLLGFKEHSQEGKTMGLASWGSPTYDFSPFLSVDGTRYGLRRGYVRYLWRTFGPRRPSHAPLTDRHKNLAASVQAFLEQAGVALAKRAYERFGIPRFCLAGGVALNCDMNARILSQPFVEDLFVQPAAHDAGVALGAALVASAQLGGWKSAPSPMRHAYWGPEFGDDEIEHVLRESRLPYTRCKDIAEAAADLLVKGKVVGWFQGRMEWGPRALGNRSILAHPALTGMKDRLNRQVKHRESWRPFAPSLLHEVGAEYVEDYRFSPFMLLTFKVRPKRRGDLKEATHVDGTVRLQSVERQTNPLFYRLIERFRDRTGIPAVLNTSFNDAGEPLVGSPRDAIRTFFSTGMDALALGSFLLEKP